MGTILTLHDWFIIIIFISLISLVTTFPDLYSLFKNKKKWIPVNFPPYLNGDEYHFFSLLNFIHRRFLNLFYRYNLSYPKLHAASKFQLFGFIFNLPAYHLGFLLGDRRHGVLFVRFWNSICLGISFFLLFYAIVNLMGIEHDMLILAFSSYIAYIIFYPGLFRIKSIILNIRKNDFMYKHDDANDLYRAMFSGTSAPLFLASSALLIYAHSINYSDIIIQIAVILPTVILFFVYLPISIVYSLAVILSSLISYNYLVLFVTLIILILLMILYIYKVNQDEVGKELFAHTDGGVIFSINPRLILRVGVIIAPCFLVAYYLFYKQYLFLGLFTLLMGVFSLTYFLKKHQLSRFYDRGSCILLQALIVIISMIFIDNTIVSLLLGIFLFGLLMYFFYNQALFLYKNYSTTSADFINNRIDFSSFFNKSKKNSVMIATDSPVISGLIDVFGSDEPLLRQYTLQPYGYKKHLDKICKNFIILNYSLEEIIKIFCKNVKKNEYMVNRPFKKSDLFSEDCCYHWSIQFIICSGEYNNQIIQDKMYDNISGWSKNYKDMISQNFKAISSDDIKANVSVV
jgi:hypothetical protein